MPCETNTNVRFLSGIVFFFACVAPVIVEILRKLLASIFLSTGFPNRHTHTMISTNNNKRMSITDYFAGAPVQQRPVSPVNVEPMVLNNNNNEYAERMQSVYKDSEFISRDKNTNIPLYNDEIVCDGLHVAMKDTFFPWRTWQTVSKKSGSSKDIGIMVHRQLRHYYTCMKRNRQTTETTCDCGLDFSKKMKMSKYTREIIKHLKENDIVIDDTEIPICDPESNVITWIDAMGHLESKPSVVVKISLKTGYSPKFKSDSKGFIFDNIGNNKIPCTTENIHHLQSLSEDIILCKVYNVRPNHSFTLYVYEEREQEQQYNTYERMMQPREKKRKRDVHCIVSRYPEWCRVIQNRNEIHESLKNRKRRKNVLPNQSQM